MYSKLFQSLFVIFGVVFVVQPATSAPPVKCDDSVKEKCVQQLFMLNGKTFPSTTTEIDAFCTKLKETKKCIRDYSMNCMKPTEKRATAVAIAGVVKMMKRLCKSEDAKKAFVKNVKCGNAAKPQMKACLSNYKMQLYGAQNVETNKKLPILCCKFFEFRGCVRNGFEEVGPEVCTPESRGFFAGVADAFQSDVFELLCGNFEDGSDICSAVEVPEVKPSAETKSFLKPMRDILKSVLEEKES